MVKFVDLDAFIKELEKDWHNVERRIVRITRVERPSSRGAVNVVLFATARLMNGDILKLEYFVGQVWPKYPEYSAITERNFAEAKQQLEKAIADLNLEVRDGIFEEAS
ncbi:hypothetical protein GG496_001505 [Candidatus Fervidibacteria bacterium JGI MDM2 JNZ-1-D12]